MKWLLVVSIFALFSCDYLYKDHHPIYGRIINKRIDTLRIIILEKISKKEREYMKKLGIDYRANYSYYDAKEGFKDAKVTWLNDSLYKSDFKLYPFDSIEVMGGMAPADARKIHFDTIIFIMPDKSQLKIFGRENIFKRFKKFNDKKYYFTI